MKDETVIVLDFLPRGKSTMRKPEPLAQVIGEKYFSLLEVIVKPNTDIKTGQKLYIGEGKREEVAYIKGRISYDDLTSVARDNIHDIIKGTIESNEQKYIDFFNNADSVTTRLHSLELIPGIGKKHMWDIINARKDKKFESFADMKKRVTLIPNPEEIIIKRILAELENKDRYRLFTTTPVRQDMGRRF